MEIYVNNTLTDPSLVTYNNGLNFGRFLSHNKVLDYKIIMSKARFISLLETPYQKALDDIREDDFTYDETSDFTDIDYCSFEELLPNSEGLTAIVDTYLHHQLFHPLLQHSNFEYVINRIDIIEVVEDDVHIIGKCFKKRNTMI